MSEPSSNDTSGLKSYMRPSLIKQRQQKLASAAIAELCASERTQGVQLSAIGAGVALCEHLSRRLHGGDFDASMTHAEAVEALVLRGMTTAESETSIAVLRAVGLIRASDEGLVVCSVEKAATEQLKLFANRSSGWERRQGNQSTTNQKLSAAADVAPRMAATAAAPAQSSLLSESGDASDPSPARYRSRPGSIHRFGPTDGIKPSEDDITVARIPCKCGGVAEVTQSYVAHLQATFRGVDVLQQVREAALWSESNPAKRKTLVGIRRFLSSWLGNARSSAQVREAVVRAGAAGNGFGHGGSYGDQALAESPAAPQGLDDFTDLVEDDQAVGGHAPVASLPSARLSPVQAARARGAASLHHRSVGGQRRLSEQH